MADIFNASNNTANTTYKLNDFLKNRLKYHTASRLASQTGEPLALAMSVDGHTVTTAKVWAAPATAFPNNANKNNIDPKDATLDLINVFKTPVYSVTTDTVFQADKTYFTLVDGTYVETAVTAGETIPTNTTYYNASTVTSETFWATDKNGNQNGKVWSNTAYPAVKLYENVPMTAVKGSDGGGKFQSFEILAAADGVSEGTLRVSDWVSPTAVADQSTGSPVAGFSGIPMYSGEALQADTTRWALAMGTWEFVAIAGTVIFEPGYTPQNKDDDSVDAATRKSIISLSAFKYVGEVVADKITNINGNIVDIENQIASLQFSAGGKELVQGTINLTADTDGNLTPAEVILSSTKDPETGEITTVTSEITGTVKDGIVTITVPGEAISVKDSDNAVLSPDMVYSANSTVLTAEYGTATIPTSSTITFRV